MKVCAALPPAASACRCARAGAYSVLLWLWQSRWIIQYYNEWSVRNIQLHRWAEWLHSVCGCLTMRCSYWLRWGFLLSSYYNIDLRQMQENGVNGGLKLWKLRNNGQQEGSMGFRSGRPLKCPGFFWGLCHMKWHIRKGHSKVQSEGRSVLLLQRLVVPSQSFSNCQIHSYLLSLWWRCLF